MSNAEAATIIVNEALAAMERESGRPIREIMLEMLANPNGNASKRFREYMEIGQRVAAEVRR